MPEYRVLITGSRDWDKPEAITKALDLMHQAMVEANSKRIDTVTLEPELYWFTLVHGACPTGADKIADDWGKEKGVRIERHPAQWNEHGKAAGPIRNQQMVDKGALVVLGFPRGQSKGTRGCLKMATDAGLLVYELEYQ
jgi:hypothetical protein